MGVGGWGWIKGKCLMSYVSKQCFFANKNMFKTNNEHVFTSVDCNKIDLLTEKL